MLGTRIFAWVDGRLMRGTGSTGETSRTPTKDDRPCGGVEEPTEELAPEFVCFNLKSTI